MKKPIYKYSIRLFLFCISSLVFITGTAAQTQTIYENKNSELVTSPVTPEIILSAPIPEGIDKDTILLVKHEVLPLLI